MNSKSDFIPTLLQHAINNLSFLNKYAGRWLVQGTLTAILLCTHYNITLQHLINGKSLRTFARMKATEGIEGNVMKVLFILLRLIVNCGYVKCDVAKYLSINTVVSM